MDFVVGDFVELTSGDLKMPKMVVFDIQRDGRIKCMWKEDGQENFEVFEPSMVQKVEPA